MLLVSIFVGFYGGINTFAFMSVEVSNQFFIFKKVRIIKFSYFYSFFVNCIF